MIIMIAMLQILDCMNDIRFSDPPLGNFERCSSIYEGHPGMLNKTRISVLVLRHKRPIIKKHALERFAVTTLVDYQYSYGYRMNSVKFGPKPI